MLRQVLCANLSYFSSLASPIVAQAADDLTAVGIVDKVENEAKVVSGDTVTPAIIGTLVHLKDELRTGVDGCLKITSRDDTVLTLGEKATVIIDRYVYDPDQNVRETVHQATKGAFRFASGRIKGAEAKQDCRLHAGRRHRRARYRVLGRFA